MKKVIGFFSVLMTISLIVFVGIQYFWLKKAFDSSVNNFSKTVYQVLNNSVKRINEKEISNFYNKFNKIYEKNIDILKDTTKEQIVFGIIDSSNIKYALYRRTIVNHSPIIVPYTDKDTLQITRLFTDDGILKVNKKDSINIVDIKNISKEIDKSPISNYTLGEFAKLSISNIKITNRINIKEIREIIDQEFNKFGIKDSSFLVSVIDENNNPTKVNDKNFPSDKNFISKSYLVPLFTDTKNSVTHYLQVYFPDQKKLQINSIIWIIFLTVGSILIVLFIYIASIYYMSHQNRIADIKTDLINNLSHEIKTPIATISIAIDMVKLDKVKKDKEKFNYYISLMKKENNRLKKQVEGILTMSQLEKKKLKLNFVQSDMIKIIEDSIEVMSLQITSRNGKIEKDFQSDNNSVFIDEFHIMNAFVNILDNANKYSPNNPHISIKTFNDNNFLFIEFKDRGKGIEENLIDKIFENFFRVEIGNIHSVKGYGLGLSYVRKIIKMHKGSIRVSSKINVGTKFLVKIPLNKKIKL